MEDVKVNLDEKRIAEILKYAEMVFLTRRFVEEMIPGCHTEKDGEKKKRIDKARVFYKKH